MNNIIIFGHTWITRHLIKNLLEINSKPKLVIAMPASKSNNISGYLDLKKFLKSHEIECYNPETYSLKNDNDIKYIENITFDFALVLGWSRLIPSKIIKKAKKAVLGVHGGPYPPPRCRGRAVFNWALIDGFKSFYLYIFKITSRIDDGEIYIKRKIKITKLDNIESIYDKHSIISSKMFIYVLKNWIRYRKIGVKQDEYKATYMPQRTPDHSGICWEDSTEKVYNLCESISQTIP